MSKPDAPPQQSTPLETEFAVAYRKHRFGTLPEVSPETFKARFASRAGR